MKKKYLNIYIGDKLNDINKGKFDVTIHDTEQDARKNKYATLKNPYAPAMGYWKFLGQIEVACNEIEKLREDYLPD